MGTKDSKHNNSEDNALFRSAVGDTQPIKKRDRIQNTAAVPRPKRNKQRTEQEQFTDPRFEHLTSTTIKPEEKLYFQRGSVNRKVMRDLRRGK